MGSEGQEIKVWFVVALDWSYFECHVRIKTSIMLYTLLKIVMLMHTSGLISNFSSSWRAAAASVLLVTWPALS